MTRDDDDSAEERLDLDVRGTIQAGDEERGSRATSQDSEEPERLDLRADKPLPPWLVSRAFKGLSRCDGWRAREYRRLRGAPYPASYRDCARALISWTTVDFASA